MDNRSTSLCCEHCKKTNAVELQDTFGIVLCPECREQFMNDIDAVIRKYRVSDSDIVLESLKKISEALYSICTHECYDYGYTEELAIADKVLKGGHGSKEINNGTL